MPISSSSLSATQILVIMLGGGLGALARFVLSGNIAHRIGDEFPYGTLTVNILGSFLMGLLAVILVERMEISPLLRLGIFVGFLGAFTTFSTFSMETINLFEQGQPMQAFINMLLSVILSVMAVWLGIILGKSLA